MTALLWVVQLALLGWFFGCIVTYRVGKWLLVEGMGVRSVEFCMLLAYVSGLLLRLVLPTAGKWLLVAVLSVWCVAQYFCHWHYTIFGATAQKLASYQRCFAHTVPLRRVSRQRIVPDLYHVVLHVLLCSNLLLVLCCA